MSAKQSLPFAVNVKLVKQILVERVFYFRAVTVLTLEFAGSRSSR